MKDHLKTRFSRVWFWFLPAWCLTVWFLSLGALGRLVSLAGTLVLGGLLIFGSGIAVRAKGQLSWGEFYLFSVGVPFGLLWLVWSIAAAWVWVH